MLLRLFLTGLFFDPEEKGEFYPKRRLTINRLQGVISQKIKFFKLCLSGLET
jgi:hypothetical protein